MFLDLLQKYIELFNISVVQRAITFERSFIEIEKTYLE